MQVLPIDVWSDIACPWCYIGLVRLMSALKSFEHRDTVQIRWHSYELNPSAPRESEGGRYAEHLASKYRVTVSEAEAMIARVCAIAQSDGLTFDYSIIRPGNTFDAHRLMHLARHQGLATEVKTRLFRGYFCEGAAIGTTEALESLAIDAGLKPEAVRECLAGDAYGDAVREDEREATALGITGVPFFVFGSQFAVSGAQPAEVLKDGMLRAYGAPPTGVTGNPG